MKINFTNEELAKCRTFAEAAAKGQGDFQGLFFHKLAECAIIKLLAPLGVVITQDWEVYPHRPHDDCSLVVNGWRFGVKGTKNAGDGIVIRAEEAAAQAAANLMCHFQILVRLGWRFGNVDGTAQVMGYMPMTWVWPKKGPQALAIKKGRPLPNSMKPAPANCYFIGENQLKTDWKALLGNCLADRPQPPGS